MLSDIITAITSTLTQFLGGLGNSLVEFFNSVFLNVTESGTTLSDLGTLCMILFGVGISFAVARWTFRLIKMR